MKKIIRKKINLKINHLLQLLQNIDDGDEGSENAIRQGLEEAKRLKLAIINSYIKFLGSEYKDLTLEKLEVIIKNLKTKLYLMKEKNNILELQFEKIINQEPIEKEKKGRGRL